MKRKALILSLISILIISISTICFATNAGNDVKNAVSGTTNAVVDGVQNLAEDARRGVGTAENVIENGVQDIGDAIMDTGDAADGAYTAERTSADDMATGNTSNATTWLWISVAVAGIVIVGVVWYYAYQNEKH